MDDIQNCDSFINILKIQTHTRAAGLVTQLVTVETCILELTGIRYESR
jgi:hypothetical protein